MRDGVVIVNSTLAAQRRMGRGEAPPPFHHWGLEPGSGDLLVGHSLGRLAIRMRRLLGGTDLSVAYQVRKAFQQGYRRLYLVTQPDLVRLLPGIRRKWPDARIVTWAWVPSEVEAWRKHLAACDCVLTLTPSAAQAGDSLIGAGRFEHQVLGSDPARYRVCPEPTRQVGIFGLANRDRATAREALRMGGFKAVATIPVAGWLGQDASGVEWVDAKGFDDVFRLVSTCRVCWVPTKVEDTFPTGLTNIVDALLSGVQVIVIRRNNLPPLVTSLPGVHFYDAGDPQDLVRATHEALATGPSAQVIREAATRVLDIKILEKRLRQLLSLPSATDARLRE